MSPEVPAKSFSLCAIACFTMMLSMLERIVTPFSIGAWVSINPASITFPKMSAPFSEHTSTKVAFPAKSPITPQLPKAKSALVGMFMVHL